MLRRFDPRIAERILFLNQFTDYFSWGGEEDKKLDDLKDFLCEML
jgi:hypothetical protein